MNTKKMKGSTQRKMFRFLTKIQEKVKRSNKKTRNDEEPANDEKAEEKDECSKNCEG